MPLLRRSLVLLFAALVFFLAAGVAATWEADRPVETLRARWAQPPSRFVPVLGMQLHLRDEGPADDPQPIVLLHGAGSSLHSWNGWAAGLRGKRRVIRLDLPGFGLSGPAPDADYSIAAYVLWVSAALDALGVKSVVLAGHALGGEIAWTLALAQPQRVQKLILVNATGYPSPLGEAPIGMPLGFKLARLQALAPVMHNTLSKGLVQSDLRSLYGVPDRVTPELVERHFELSLRQGNRRALGQVMRQARHDDAARIQQIKQPALILWGGLDRWLPPEQGERFAGDIRSAQRMRMAALGHMPHEEDPASTLAPLREFLSQP
jgi:pimeloyl-ACP methyl ester carboxylesterase